MAERLWTLFFCCLIATLVRAEPDDDKQQSPPDVGVYIRKVSVMSEGLGEPGFAAIEVDAPLTVPVEIVWSDASTWLPAEGHPNYTISTTSKADKDRAIHRSAIKIREMLSQYVSADFDFYYIPISVDVRADEGHFLYQQTLKIPINPAKSRHVRDNFEILEIPPATVSYKEDSKVDLRWVFLTEAENEYTVWRTVMKGPDQFKDLNYTDEMLYAEDLVNMYPDDVLKSEHIQVKKNVELIGKKYKVTIGVTIAPVTKSDQALYVLYLRSRSKQAWEDTINLRLSTRLLYDDNKSLMANEVAVALSYCDGAYLEATEHPYVGLQRGSENCVKCETYGNRAEELVFMKNGEVLEPSKYNSIVQSRYYPETIIAMYTFRKEVQDDEGVYSCRARIKDGADIRRDFYVAWTEKLMMSSQLKMWNSTQAQISCASFANPIAHLSFWRCEGKPKCVMTELKTGPKFNVTITPEPDKGVTVGTVVVTGPPSELYREAIVCRTGNNFQKEERWTVFAEWVPRDIEREVEEETEAEGEFVKSSTDSAGDEALASLVV